MVKVPSVYLSTTTMITIATTMAIVMAATQIVNIKIAVIMLMVIFSCLC